MLITERIDQETPRTPSTEKTRCDELQSVGHFLKTGSFDKAAVETTVTSELPKAAASEVMEGDLAGAVDKLVAPPGEKECLSPWERVKRDARLRAEKGKEDTNREIAEMGDLHVDIEGNLLNRVTSFAPKNCGYKLEKFSQSQVNLMCQAMNEVINDEPVNCHVSNCTTMSYLALIKLAKLRPDWEEKKSLFECTSPFPSPYLHYGNAGIAAFVDEYGLGQSKELSSNQSVLKDQFGGEGWHREGDALGLERKNGSAIKSSLAIISPMMVKFMKGRADNPSKKYVIGRAIREPTVLALNVKEFQTWPPFR